MRALGHGPHTNGVAPSIATPGVRIQRRNSRANAHVACDPIAASFEDDRARIARDTWRLVGVARGDAEPARAVGHLRVGALGGGVHPEGVGSGMPFESTGATGEGPAFTA